MMNTKPRIQVIDVVEPPAIGKIAMMSGIRTKEAAEKWAIVNGYPTVYFWKQRERVYADKMSRIDLEALTLQKRSEDLVQLGESGQSLIGLCLFALFVAGAVI